MSPMQVKVFNSSTGALAATVGRAGGYSDGNTTASTDKLWLLPPVFGTAANACHFSRGSFVAIDEGGDVEGVWVNDFGNRRILHLDPLTGAELPGSIAYIPSTYRSAVHSGDPSRVFVNFLEFSVDYAVPNAMGWALVRNWGAGLPESFQANGYNSGLGRWEWAGFQAIGWSSSLGLTVAIVDCYPEAAQGSENGYVLQAVLLDESTHQLQMLQVMVTPTCCARQYETPVSFLAPFRLELLVREQHRLVSLPAHRRRDALDARPHRRGRGGVLLAGCLGGAARAQCQRLWATRLGVARACHRSVQWCGCASVRRARASGECLTVAPLAFF